MEAKQKEAPQYETTEALIACLGDDAAKLRDVNPDDEMAASMVAAVDRLEHIQAANDELVKALQSCLTSLERATTTEGVCCCGDDMARHSDPMMCGHSPVDMGDYYASQAIEAARAALTKAAT